MRLIKTLLPILALTGITCAQDAPSAETRSFEVREHYTKYEYRIPMRDGIHLFTSVYVPKEGSRAYPFLINRTPYSVGPYGVDRFPERLGPSLDFDQAGYIFVFQDVRGRWMSEGTFVEMRPHIDRKKSNKDVDESTDLYDTIDWLLKHVPHNNGRAGIWGISYPGFFTSASMIDSHPALKAASPQAPVTNLFMGDDTYHGGAFMLAANFGFYTGFRQQDHPQLPPKTTMPFDFGTNNGYDFYLNTAATANLSPEPKGKNLLWEDQVLHDTYDDYWKARDIAPHLKNIHCAVLTVGGWFDAEDLQGPFSTFRAVDQYNSGIFNALVVGPWVHGGWYDYEGKSLGSVRFALKTGDYYRKNILFPFFEQYLKGNVDAKLPKAYVFETGTNLWRQYSSWPPANTTKQMLYFQSDGGLSFTAPHAGDAAYDEYISDPNKPVPFVSYTTRGIPAEYMIADQRFATTRTDVLVYKTPPLEEDVTIAGPISPRLFVSTTGTDSDFDVKLIDVYPPDETEKPPRDQTKEPADVPPPTIELGEYQQLVRGEPFRAKFRHSFERPEPLIPGKVEEITFPMPDVNHTFGRGHRIMVHVQSSWFPLTDRNPQTFVDIPHAKSSDFVKATERVYHTPQQASGIEVNVLPSFSAGEK